MSADRGRVPFALLAALLLVTSAALAASTGPAGPPSDPAVATALDRARTATGSTVRGSVAAAGRAAARAPVVRPANTSVGRVLDEAHPFRDSLRLRVYLTARRRLARLDRRVGDVRVTARLPPTPDPAALERALDSVSLARVNGTALRVGLANVTLVARRDGRVLARRHLSPTVTVASPVLALHDRVAAFQRRLNASVTDPGLARRFSVGVYALAWARGYAQYRGAPIENVVTNRHVALTVNEALLHLQRATIGHSDPDGRRALVRATARVGLLDALGAAGMRNRFTDYVLGGPTNPAPGTIDGWGAGGGTRRENVTVGVNASAGTAFVTYVGDGGLNRTLGRTYSADVRLLATVRGSPPPDPPAPASPGPGWTRVGHNRTTERSTGDARVAPPSVPDGWHTLAIYNRTVTVERTRSRRWRRGNETRVTRTRTTAGRRVALAVVGRHALTTPERGIATVHERGAGPFDGPNLADVRAAAVDRLVTERGGPDALARRAVRGELDTGAVFVAGDRPASLRQWVYRDLAALRGRVRNVSVSVPRQAIGTFSVNPPSRLADRLRTRRAALVDAPDTYGSVAEKARVAARAAYLDTVIERLERRAAARRSRAGAMNHQLDDAGAGSLAALRRNASARRGRHRDRPSTLRGPGGPLSLRVDAAPAYLTLGAVGPDRVPALENESHPLVARNRDLMALPYAGVAGGIVDFLFNGPDRTALDTAARTLSAANATLARADPGGDARDALTDGHLVHTRARLRDRVNASTTALAVRLRATLDDEGVGHDDDARRAIVAAALAQWETPRARALALTNGSAAPAVAAVAAQRANLSSAERDWLRLRLAADLRRARHADAARPRVSAVNDSRRAARAVAHRVARRTATRVARRAANATARRAWGRVVNETVTEIPAGFPVAPAPGLWYATMDVWTVQARGEYARFAVRTDRGFPGRPVTYVRDGDPVRLDVDGDGARELLGRASRIRFAASTTVVVVVPPGGTGVGDVNGVRDEQSSGWPEPGG